MHEPTRWATQAVMPLSGHAPVMPPSAQSRGSLTFEPAQRDVLATSKRR
jgi:hypothetical protein